MKFGTVIELEKGNILRYWAILYLHLGPFYNNFKFSIKNHIFCPKISHIIAIPEGIVMKFGRILAL